MVAVLDWSGAALQSFSVRSVDEAFTPQADLAAYLAAQPGRFRVYSPSYSLPQHLAAQHGLEVADGVDPLQLAAYVDFMEGATGVPQSGYSVTLPAFAGGDPAHDNADAVPNPRRLGLLNVRYLAAEFDVKGDGLVFRREFGETRLYENEYVLPRAWVQPADAEMGQKATPAEILTWEPNRVAIQAEGPGLLVLSELSYPGWRVRVDGKPAEMESVADLLRGVALDAGEHRVEFIFRPWSVPLGLALFVVGLGFVFAVKRTKWLIIQEMGV